MTNASPPSEPLTPPLQAQDAAAPHPENQGPHEPPPWHPELPKLGGVLGPSFEDFKVEEVALYEPSGEGSHIYLWIEKHGLNTRDVAQIIARAAGVPESEVGYAGLKDRHAVTRQWLSLPERSTPRADWELPSFENGAALHILKESKHKNKLRTGHVLGNRFELRLVDYEPSWGDRWPALSAALEQGGFYNYFGRQRFGHSGQNLGRALHWLSQGARGRGFQPKLAASVLQSEVFNRYLSARRALGFEAPLLGEVVRLDGTGKHFVVADIAAEKHRWSTRDLHPTGPIPGPKMLKPSGSALELEERITAEVGLTELPREFNKLAPGARRDLFVFPKEISLKQDGSKLALSFFLPSGSYATELVSALTGRLARLPFDAR